MSFDLDAVIAEREAIQPFTFSFDGNTYTMPSDVDVEVVDLLAEGQIAPALEMLLGEEQWSEIVASPKLLGAIALGELVTAYMEHIGVSDLGESSASPRSLNRTARRSKRTSNGSTGSASRNLAAVSPGDGSESS